MQELATSINRRALTLKLLQVNSDTTVLRYVSSCLSFFSFVADLGLDLATLTQVQAVEAIMALHLSKHQDQDDPFDASSAALVHPVNTLKAFRWLIKVSLLQFPDAYGGLFRALSSGPTSDRKEALALPLDFVAYRTKTTRRGMPFACHGRGFYGYWAATWLRSLDRLWLYLEDAGLCIDPDSLFFVSDAPGFGAGSLDLAFAPASYASALRSLRQALSLWGHLSQQQWPITRCIHPKQRPCLGLHSSGSRSSRDGSKDTTGPTRCPSMAEMRPSLLWPSKLRFCLALAVAGAQLLRSIVEARCL